MYDSEDSFGHSAYPCQTCHRPFGSRRKLAYHDCATGLMPGEYPGKTFVYKEPLSDDDIRAIREAYSKGAITQAQLGRQYNRSQSVIRRIISRETYSDVE